MPTYDTANTTETYQVPDGVEYIEIEALGAGGGNGAGGLANGNIASSGGPGGPGGRALGRLPVSPGETFTIYVPSSGDDASGPDGGAPGQSPMDDGGSGGDGYQQDADNYGGGAGAGGAPAILVRDSDGAVLLVGEGGGGGGGGSGGESFDSPTSGGAGAGGGARGGPGGPGGAGTEGDGTAGADAEGAGNGGAGGAGAEGTSEYLDGDPGSPGGATVHADLTQTTTAEGDGNDGDGAVIIREAPPAPSLGVASASDTSVTLDIGDTSDEDGVEVEYRETGTSSWTLDADLGAGAVPTQHTVSGLAQGRDYEFRAVAYNAVGSSSSDIVSATTEILEPINVDATTVDATSIGITWTLQSTDEDGVRVYQSQDGGATWTEIADLAAGSESYTATGLLHGDQYEYQIEAYTSDASATSSPDSAITDLPDVTVDAITPIDASVEDELTVPNPGITNNGSYRVRYRETGTSGWTDWGTVAHDGSDVTITGLADGEQYDIAVRSETVDVTGPYATVSEVTLLPVPTAVSVVGRADSVTIAFVDEADNEVRHCLERNVDGAGWESIATVDPNVEQIFDPDPVDYQPTQYRVVAETEHVTSTSDTVTTIPVQAEQFHAELERGDSLLAITPGDLISVGDITLEHTTPSAFSLRVSPSATSYEDYCLGDARLFYGEQRFFSGRLDSASTNRGVTTLSGEGQLVELERDTTVTTYQDLPGQDAIKDYVTNVPGTWTVHDPYVRTIDQDNIWYDTDVADDIDQLVTNDETDPVIATIDEVRLAQTCWFREAEDAATLVGDTVSTSDTGTDYSGFEAVRLSSSNDIVGVRFTPQYSVPGADVRHLSRISLDSFDGEIVLRLDGNELRRISYNGATSSIDWQLALAPDSVDDLSAGTEYEFQIETENVDGGSLTVDAIAPYDSGDRFDHPLAVFDYTWDNTVDTEFYTLSGPGLYPVSFPVFLSTAEAIWHVPEATLETTIDDTSNNQALRLSPNGTDWVTASNAQSTTADFDAASIYGTAVYPEIVLSRYASDNTTTPSSGDAGQVCSDVRLVIDMDDLPLIDGEWVADGDTWLENLQTLHDRADARFVVDHQADALVVESFRAGDPGLVQADDWITDGADAVETDRVTGDYFNRIRAVPSDPTSGISSVTLLDLDEIDRVGEEIQQSRTFDVDSRTDLQQEARRALREGVAGDEFSGRINIVPTDVQPGYPYEPEEFGNELTNAEQVTYTISDGDISGQISFGARRDLVARIQQRTRGN